MRFPCNGYLVKVVVVVLAALIRNNPPPLGPPYVPRHRATVGSYGGGGLLMSEVPLYSFDIGTPGCGMHAVCEERGRDTGVPRP